MTATSSVPLDGPIVSASSSASIDTIGLSTYSYFWQWSSRASSPITLDDMLRKTADFGVTLLQICDYPPLDDFDRPALDRLLQLARDLGVRLEVGTKGIAPDHLLRYLDVAVALEAPLLRSMLHVPGHRPSVAEAVRSLTDTMGRFEERGVTLALETYEQVPTAQLVRVVLEVDHPLLGICLDPANPVAALEHPTDVIDLTAAHVKNLHIKDFAFSRSDGWVGFTYSGARMGSGLLDYDYLIERTDARSKGISQVVEHWLGWQGDISSTVGMEDEWTQATLDFLRAKQQAA